MSSTRFTPKRVIHPQTHVMELGKYKGRKLNEVIAFDPSYISWMRSKSWSSTDKVFIELIKDVEVPDITFGKHKGKTLKWLMEYDESYVKFLWSSDYVREKHPELKKKLDLVYI